MKITFLTLLTILVSSNLAYAERSYLMIPDAVEQAEKLSEAANNLGRKHTGQAPHSAREAMNRLRHIDDDLDSIILLARRFQQTNRLLERGILDAKNFAQKNSTFVAEWGPVLRGNYLLMQTIFEDRRTDNIRTIVAMEILDSLVNSISKRIESAHTAINFQLEFSKEASVVNAARQRLYYQLTEIRKNLNSIRNRARAQM